MFHAMECREETALVSLHGRMTYSDHTGFRALLAELLRTDATRWRFDLSGLRFADSTAVIMLMVAREAAAEVGAAIEFQGASGCVRRMCIVTGMTGLLPAESAA
ncbi:MAG TPA: STAS domain-containing protein [Azospirillum sp.]|nr:STAS domain-containing protein [Azospirillum sp.]